MPVPQPLGGRRRMERVAELVHQTRNFSDGMEQQQGPARLGIFAERDESVVHFGVAMELFRAGAQPGLERESSRAQLGEQLGVIALGIVHQIAGMHLEETRQQLPRVVRQVRPRPAFDLRKIGLADGFAQILAEAADDFGLSHGPVEGTELPLDQAEVADFLSQSHEALYRKSLYAYSNLQSSCQEKSESSQLTPVFSMNLATNGTTNFRVRSIGAAVGAYGLIEQGLFIHLAAESARELLNHGYGPRRFGGVQPLAAGGAKSRWIERCARAGHNEGCQCGAARLVGHANHRRLLHAVH